MSEQSADNQQAVSAIGSNARERMAKGVDTNIVQARCRPDAHPELLKADHAARSRFETILGGARQISGFRSRSRLEGRSESLAILDRDPRTMDRNTVRRQGGDGARQIFGCHPQKRRQQVLGVGQ